MLAGLRSLTAVLLTLLLAASASAGTSVLIWPLDPTIEPGQKATALWLENVGSVPVNLQIRVLAWEQHDFKDHHTEQQIVVGTPPFASIAPGKKQLVRLTLTAPLKAGEERAFRILVDEIPGPSVPANSGLRMQMRYSLPLFAYGQGLWRKNNGRTPDGVQAKPSLSWKFVDVDGTRYLQVRNSGLGHARLSQVRFIDVANVRGSNGDVIDVASGLLGYVLPGQVMRWPAPAGASAGRLQVQLEANAPPVIVPSE
jgi:fimbrial chaperone protein